MFSTAIPTTQPKPAKKARRNIPAALVREVVEGIPFYYPGYRAVLNKTKKLEDIMSDSGLQSVLKNIIGDAIKPQVDRKQLGPKKSSGFLQKVKPLSKPRV